MGRLRLREIRSPVPLKLQEDPSTYLRSRSPRNKGRGTFDGVHSQWTGVHLIGIWWEFWVPGLVSCSFGMTPNTQGLYCLTRMKGPRTGTCSLKEDPHSGKERWCACRADQCEPRLDCRTWLHQSSGKASSQEPSNQVTRMMILFSATERQEWVGLVPV